MFEGPNRLAIPALLLIVIGSVALAFVWVEDRGRLIVVGFLFGTLFGHATVSAAWNVIGAGKVKDRMLVAGGWLVLLLICIGINVAINGYEHEYFLLAASITGQWLGVHAPLAILRFFFSYRITYSAAAPSGTSHRSVQFGIKELMILTTVVAVILGLGRFTVTAGLWEPTSPGTPVYLFLAAAAVLTSVPLLIAAMLPRRYLLAVLVALLLISVVTYWEIPLVQQFGPMPEPESIMVVVANAVTSIWVLAFVIAARLNGYVMERKAIAPAA